MKFKDLEVGHVFSYEETHKTYTFPNWGTKINETPYKLGIANAVVEDEDDKYILTTFSGEEEVKDMGLE